MVATMLGLVDRAGPAHPVGEVGRGPLAERGEAVGRLGLLPAAPVGQPPRGREVVEGDDRVDAHVEQGLALAAGSGRGPPIENSPSSGSMRLHSREKR